MACPQCGCKVSYQYDPGDDLEQTDARLERCASCRHVFDIEDHADEHDEDAYGVAIPDKVQLPEKARAGIEVLHQVVEALLTTSRYIDEEGEATQALADLSDCIADPLFRLAGNAGVPAPDEGQSNCDGVAESSSKERNGNADWTKAGTGVNSPTSSGLISRKAYTGSVGSNPTAVAPPTVDWLGLALDLEAQARRVESQTVERAMLAAAHGLRLMGTHGVSVPVHQDSPQPTGGNGNVNQQEREG